MNNFSERSNITLNRHYTVIVYVYVYSTGELHTTTNTMKIQEPKHNAFSSGVETSVQQWGCKGLPWAPAGVAVLSTTRAPVQLDQMRWGGVTRGLNLPTSASLSKYTQMIESHRSLSAEWCGNGRFDGRLFPIPPYLVTSLMTKTNSGLPGSNRQCV